MLFSFLLHQVHLISWLLMPLASLVGLIFKDTSRPVVLFLFVFSLRLTVSRFVTKQRAGCGELSRPPSTQERGLFQWKTPDNPLWRRSTTWSCRYRLQQWKRREGRRMEDRWGWQCLPSEKMVCVCMTAIRFFHIKIYPPPSPSSFSSCFLLPARQLYWWLVWVFCLHRRTAFFCVPTSAPFCLLRGKGKGLAQFSLWQQQHQQRKQQQ